MSCFGKWQFNPSEGLLLTFSSDLVYLVQIRGSMLNKLLGDANIDLIQAGLQRHRVLCVREMSEDDIRQVGHSGPTVDSIEIAEFESQSRIAIRLTATATALHTQSWPFRLAKHLMFNSLGWTIPRHATFACAHCLCVICS